MKRDLSTPKNVEDVYPLSPMQEGMLFHSLYAPASGVYITQLSCTLEGLRIEPFQRAWQAVVDRHPILRTGFVWKNTQRLLQVVGRQVGVPFQQQDWRELTPAEQAGQWAAHVWADRHRDFDFGRAPLLRLSLVRLGEATYRLLWTCHHILLDGWCSSMVLREVFASYQAFCEGEGGQVDGLGPPRPYRDYISWLQTQDRAAAEGFWRRVLAGFTAPTPVELGGAPEGAEAGPRYGRERLFLDEAATGAAELLARQHNLTLNTLVLGTWALVLGRISGEPEVLFGTVVSGRPPELPGVEEIVGPLLNTLPLRVALAPGQTVVAWLGSIQALQVEMRQYEHTPLADLQKWSGVPAGRPLFDSVLAFENYPRAESALARLPGLAVRDVWSDEQTNFPLSISFVPVGGRLRINVFYERARYERTAIQRLLGHLAAQLARMVAFPGRRLGDLSPLSEAERHQLESEWSDTWTARDGATALHLFEEQAGRTPEAVAVASDDRSVTYRELEERANQLARHLRRLGAEPERLVGLCLERSIEMVESLLAVWKAGAAYLPLDPALPADRLAFLLADSGVPLLVTDSAIAASLPEHGSRVLRLDAAAGAIAGEGAGRLDGGPAPNRLAYLIYTSGTTGRPKAVMVEHAALANVLLACRERFPLPGGGAMPQMASFSFDISLFELFAPLLAGGRSVLVPRDEILDVPRLATRLAGMAAFHAVPSLMRQIVDHLRQQGARSGGPALVFTGGDLVPPDLLAGLREVFPAARLAVLYGPTEGTIVGSAWPVPVEGAPARPLIGRPFANVELRVVDGCRETVPLGVGGELCIGGAGVARGYLGRPELTRERFVELGGRRFYRTGDLVRWRPDGNLEFLGRIDDQVKIHGFRVEPGEIEAVLREHPGVAGAAVLAPVEGAGRRLVAFVIAAGAGASTAELRAHLGRKLPAYMVPAAFSFLPELPLTPHGKVDRRALAGLEGGVRAAAQRESIAPRTVDEERLAAIWAEVLRVERIGIHDNFFELGGDSILSIQIVARATRAGFRLTPKDVFEHPTVAELAGMAADAAPAAQAEQGLVTGAVPLTPIQRRFFALGSPEPHHFNLSLLLTVDPAFGAATLARAVRQLALHHDALRARFRQGEDGWEQAIAGVEGLPRLVHLDLAALPAERRAAALEAAAADVQASLDLGSGPLLRPAFFTLAPGAPGRLLLAAHHLVVDGVSWRILLEDLETACRQLAAGEAVRLPAKTTSFKDWAERQQARDGSAASSPRSRAAHPVSTMATARAHTVVLEAGETRALLSEVPAAYRTRINDVLLAALALACARWTGEPSLLVDLEGHGRDEEAFPGVDLSRTVGWFTAIDPVLLEAAGPEDPGALLRRIKEQLRAARPAAARDELPEPEIGFNYLGRLDLVLPAGSAFAPAPEPAGPAVSRQAVRPHLLEVNASVAGGRLRTSWSYSSAVHRRETVERLAAGYQEALRTLIAHCLAPEAGGATPSDFPLARLDPASLDLLLGDGPRARRVEDVYPLSPLQEGMLFHALYAPDEGAYVTQMVCELAGALDVAALRRAWQEVMDRHAVLRTGFAWEGLERPLQVALRAVPVPLEAEDWRGLSVAERQTSLAAFLREDRRRGFTMSREPLMRVALLRLDEELYTCLWTSHHILLDGWCLSLLFKELLGFYEAFRAGRELAPPRPRPYRDYIAWLERQSLAEAEAFWRRELAGHTEPARLALAAVAADAEGQDELQVAVPAETADALRSLARQRQLTLNTLLQGAWAVVLSWYCGTDDVVFGATVSGRPAALPGVESMIGLFINTLPVRVRVPLASAPPAWMGELQDRQLELRQYEHAPLASVQRWSELPPGQGLFETLLVFESYPVDPTVRREAVSFEVRNLRTAEKTSYPLTVGVSPLDRIVLKATSDRGRFEGAAIRRMMDHLLAVLAGLAADLDRPVADLPLLTGAERRQVEEEWAGEEGAAPERLVPELLAEIAGRHPESPVLSGQGKEMTWRELDRRSGALARQLAGLGVAPGVRVGLCLERSLETVVAILGIWKAGGAYVPLDPDLPAERLRFLLEDSAVPVLAGTAASLGALPENGARRLLLDAPEDAAPGAPPPFARRPEHPAYLIYTSGTTGRPKAVEVGHGSLAHTLRASLERFGSVASMLHLASFSFDISLFELLLPLLSGGRSVLLTRQEVLDVPALAARLGEVEAVHAVPSLMRQIVGALRGAERPETAGPRRIFTGGDAVPGDLLAALRDLFPAAAVAVLYGPTEGTIICSSWEVPRRGEASGLLGRPLPGVRLRVVDRHERPVPVGLPGELWIGGPGVARGYAGRDELTRERFVERGGRRFYRTGDLARWREDGTLEFAGRTDDQVKVRGFRVEPGEIEGSLAEHPGVREAVVLARGEAGGDRRLAAFVVADGAPPSPSELREHLGRRLPEHMIPAGFTVLEALPLTVHGKVDRRALAALAAPARGAAGDLFAPRSRAEAALAEIWSQVLKVERVGIEDNFFELGGDSILSIQIVARAHSAGLRLSPRDLFEHPTIAELAELGSAAGDGPAPRANPGLVTGPVPLTPVQRRFFAQGSPEPHHFNLPLLLTVRPDLGPAVLAAAVRRLALHHDALRLRFRRGAEGWEGSIAGVEGLPQLAHLDLAGLPAERRPAALEGTAAVLQASLDLERAPLLRAAFFDLGAGEAGRLLLIVHHLLVDGVSWRILLEDLETVCGQLANGEPVRLPEKTTSFQEWAERLEERADRRTGPGRPAARPGGGAANTVAAARTLTLSLDEAETRALLTEVPAAYRTRINDVLLCALAGARWSGESSFLVDLEGHGREEDAFPGVDLSRTVGWLTSIRPVRIDPGPGAAGDPGSLLKRVKEQLREALEEDAPGGLPEAEIAFNYLGQLDRVLSAGSAFAPAPEPAGPAVSRRTVRGHLLEVKAGVVEGCLRTSWTYAPAVHRREAIERLADEYRNALREILAHCLSPAAGGATPSDFPLARLAQEPLDRLLGDGPRARRVEDVYPLSPLQQGMLFHSLFAPEGGTYVVQRSAELVGALDEAAFRGAWQELIDRHAVLRTGFAWQDLDRPLQVVHGGVAVPLTALDWSAFPEDERRRRAGAYLDADRRRGFDLQSAPLLRLSLLRTAPDRHLWVWSCHHLLLDGWCMGLLFDELLRLYAAGAAGRALRLPRARPYRDYIAWLERQDLAAAEAFWRRTLAGFGAPTELPLAHDPGGPAGAPGRRRQERALVPPETAAALQAFGRRHQLTLNTLVEAAWSLVLARYAGGAGEVLFGITVSGRPAELPGVESMIGLFINSLPRRVALDPAAPLLPWLARLQGEHLDLRQYEHTPLADVQRWSEVRGGRLFESFFSFENYPMDAEALRRHPTGLEIAGLAGAEETDYPVDLAVMAARELSLLLAYDGARLDPAVAGRMLASLGALLAGLAADPQRRIGDLEVLTPAERRQLLVDWNRTATPFPEDRCLHELFAERAAASPDALALLAPDAELTFGALDRQAGRLARHLRRLGVGPETVVGLCVERSADLAVGLLGILKAGGAYLPLDPSYPAERLAYMLEDARVPLLLTQERLLSRLDVEAQGTRVLCLDAAWPEVAGEEPAGPAPAAGPRSLAYAIYTSGSTGRAKSALVEHRALVNYALEMARQLDLGPGDRILQFASVAFDVLLEELFPAWLAGGAVVLPGSDLLLSVDALQEVIRTRGVTGLELPAAYWQEWVHELEGNGGPPPSLRFVIVGSEKPSAARLAAWQRFGVPLVYVFGLTETAVTSTLYKLPEGAGPADLDLPIGRPVANTALYLLGRDLQPVPEGVAGELFIGGAGVGRGYLHRPALTAERFVPDSFGDVPGARLYRTGDLARYRADGNLDFLGRMDHQVKIRGFRVELGEVEAALRQLPAVKDAVADAPVAAAGGRRLVAYVVAERALGAEELRAHLEQWLPEHMLPSAYVFLDALPLTPNGKVDRRALPAPEAGRGAAQGSAAPQTPTEETLAAIWAEVLGVGRVGVEDDFFALGGDSILSLQVTSKARRAGLLVQPRDLFENPTVARLARVAGALEAAAAAQEEALGPVPLTPIQHWFFAQGFAAPHHFNLPLLLELRRPVAFAVLHRVLVRLLAHHDALRLRFAAADGEWRQQAAPPEGAAPAGAIDLAALPEAVQAAALEAAGAALQASLDLAAGPLLRAALFDLGAGRPQRLLLAAHHLALDTVSWQILAEDLAEGLRQAAAGEEIALPPKSTSFQRWAERLAAYACAPAVAAELDWWGAEPRAHAARLPVDEPGGSSTRRGARTVQEVLDAETTRALLQEIPGLARTQIQEVLIAALASALAQWTGEPLLLIDCEGHGRDALFDGLDLSRTVGWFTSIYPVLVDLRGAGRPAEALVAVKEQLRAMPGSGLGYGLLRHLGAEDARRRLAALPPAQVLFNYVGQLGQGMPADLPFGLGRDPVGPPQDPRESRTHLLEVNADVLDGRLRMSWTYGEGVHRRATIEALCRGMAASLRAILAACRAGEAAGLTPFDFPLAARTGLTREQLDALAAGRPEIADVYPLSPLQRGMLFDLLFQPRAGLYCGLFVCELHGDLDVATFRAAWQRVLDRHPALRTTFHWEGLAEPLQVVAETLPLPLTLEDWRGLPEAAQEERLAALVEAERERGFVPTGLPLMRLVLARKSEGVHQLVWSFLQILFDGWSLPLIFQEGLGGYAARLRGEEPRPAPARDLRDYIAWLRRRDPRGSEAYWRQALAGLENPTPLPAADRAWTGTPGEGWGYARRNHRLGRALTAELRSLGRSHQLTQNTLVQGAWALLLARSSGEREVTFGVVVAGRPAELAGAEEMVGLFINTLPARVPVPPEEPAAAWLTRLQEQAVGLREHEHTPLSDVQRWSGVPAGWRLFETILVFENYPVAESLREPQGGLAVREVQISEKAAFPLSLAAFAGDELHLIASFYRQAYDDATVVRLLRQLEALLAGLAADPSARLAALPLLDEAERHQLTREWSDTAAPAGGLLLDRWAEQVALRPQAVAVLAREESLSYGELDRRANRLAHRLRRAGVGPEVPVGVCLERSPDVLAAALAVWKAGGAYVPLDPAYPAERLAFMLEETGAPVLVTAAGLAGLFPETAERILLDADASALAAESGAAPGGAPAPADLAYLIFTSGSTGRPKAVQVEHGSLANTLLGNLGRFGFGPSDAMPAMAAFSFDISLFESFVPLLAGGTTVLLTRQEVLDPEALGGMLGRVTAIHAVPGLMRQIASLAAAQGGGYGNLRALFVGGDYVAPELLELLRRTFPSARLTVLYGPTEATIICTACEVPAAGSLERSLIGRPLANAGIRLLDADGHEVPVGVPGEICVTGPGVARGYLGRPELTAERFVRVDGARAYRTGDLARRRPDGELEFLGRSDEQVKIRGHRVEPGEVEAVLAAHPAVREAAVLARAAGGGQERRLVAWFVPAEEPAPPVSELRDWLGARLPDYMVPAVLVPLPRLPRLPTGKLDRRALPGPGEDLAPAGGGAAPRTEVEARLVEIWREVLGRGPVGIDDDFFALGGDSLLSIQIVARANQAGIRLTPQQIFELRTIARLAEAAGSAPAALAEQSPVTGRVPLTPVQRRFFASPPPRLGHFNQATLLEVHRRLEIAPLQGAVAALLAHHDALRLRFTAGPDGWEQRNDGPEAAEPPLAWLDLSELAEEAARPAIARAMEDLQQSLDVTAGPLVRVACLDFGAGRPGRLWIAVHHLAVDDVSWPILLEDLESSYGQAVRGEPVRLPAKTTSFRHWAELLEGHARSAGIRAELADWTAEPRHRVPRLPLDLPGVNDERSCRTVWVGLEESATESLLRDVPAAYGAQAQEALLTALAQALEAWRGSAGPVLVDLEGHGREAELFPGVDLSRTVGWFTTIYPVLLDVAGADGPGVALQRVKEQLRAVPGRGIGYGLLRYLGGEDAAGRLAALPAAEVSFNYAGQGGGPGGARPAAGSVFRAARESSGPSHGLLAQRHHLLEVDGRIADGRLRLGFTYSTNLHAPATIERLAEGCLAALRALIAHCQAPEAVGYTPSDFPLMSLSQEDLDALVADEDDF